MYTAKKQLKNLNLTRFTKILCVSIDPQNDVFYLRFVYGQKQKKNTLLHHLATRAREVK